MRYLWLDGYATGTQRWIAVNLMMGYESGVSRAVNLVERKAAKELIAMKSALMNAGCS